jgi:hypothetical protein
MFGSHTEAPSTDFAITSVNVPDRLDQREVNDRKLEEEESLYARRGPGINLRVWGRRLLPYLVLAAVVGLAGIWLANERETLGPQRVSQRLSAVLHVPVRVQDSRLRTTPAPALVLTGIDLGGQVRLDEVALEFTAPSLWRAVLSGQHRWGDVVISPLTLSFDQAAQLLAWLGSLDRALPDSATKVRITEVRFAGSGLLPDRYEVITRRDAKGQFTSVALRKLNGPGSMQVQLTPDPAGGTIAFQIDGADWQPPFVPHTAWTELVAAGHVRVGAIELDQFTLGSGFGAVEGALSVRREDGAAGAWKATGTVSSVGIDLPTLAEQIIHPGKPAEDATSGVVPPMSGTAAIEASLSGAGATPEEALGRMVAAGDVKVRSAMLNGINLGYAATHPPAAGSSGNGASTRFTQFASSFVAGPSGVLFRNIHGVAGALSTRGELAVSPDLALDGLLHVNLGGARIQAPLRVHVRGTAEHPVFGR